MTILTACPAVTGPPAPATLPPGRRTTAAASAALLAGLGPEWKPCPVPAEPPGQSSFTTTRLDRKPCARCPEDRVIDDRGRTVCAGGRAAGWRSCQRGLPVFPARECPR